MPSKQQIRLINMAAREVGLRTKQSDKRYYMLLGQYKQSNGRMATSCKQLNNSQIEDFLAICESLGWRYPGKAQDHFREKVAGRDESAASFAQQSTIFKLAGDLGWMDNNLAGFVKKMTKERTASVADMSKAEASKIIEGLKNILGRERGRKYSSVTEVQKEMEVVTDGKKTKIG